MKKSILFFITILFLISGICFSFGFNSISSPDGLYVIAVGDSGKLFRSSNIGVSYEYSIISNNNLLCVTSFNNDVWISAQNGNILKTSKTNSPVLNYNVGNNINLNSIYFINSNIGFVCGDNGFVYKSSNGGINWFLSNSGITSTKLNSIHFKDLNNGTVVGNEGIIFITTDGGLNWNLQPIITTKNLLKVKYFADGIVAVGEYGIILTKPTSGSWTSIITRTDSDIRGVTGSGLNNAIVCGGGGFIRNNLNGKSNFSNFEKNPMLANLVDIFYFDNNYGFAVSNLNNAAIRTTNGGQNWELPLGAIVSYNWVQKSPNGSGIGNTLCMHPKDRNSAFVVYGNKVYVTRNKGESWIQISTVVSGSRAHSFYVSPLDTNIWVCAIESSPDRVVRTTDYGATWNSVIAYDFSSYGQPLEMDQNNPSVFYYAPTNTSGTGLFKSTDNGESFILVAPYNNSSIGSPCDLIVMWDSSNAIFMGDDGAEIYKSINGGINWLLVKPGTSSEIPSMSNSVFDKSICYATTWGSTQVYKTTNFGDNWFITSNNSGSGWASDVCHEDPTVVLTGNYGSQAYLSTNSGTSFFNINTGLSGAGAGMMVPERDYMLNMQTGSLYKLNVSYSYIPDSTFIIDVQPFSVGINGVQYFQNSTINPTGIVKNNSTIRSTFTVTRKINPGGYINTQTITNLDTNTTFIVTFAPWTFTSGVTYTIKDSVHIENDFNTHNDTLSGIIIPILGQSYYPLNEAFNSTSFPPVNWSLIYTGTSYWFRSPVSSYGLGSGSAKFNYWNASSGINQSMVTNTFNPTFSGDSLKFNNAYAPFTFGTDSLNIETSTNGGLNYFTLVRLFGNNTGKATLNSTGVSIIEFTPNSSQWITKSFALPTGTNKIKFTALSGNGNNLYIDSIRISSYNLFTQAFIKVIPEALYNRFTLNQKDTLTAYLREITSPYNKIDSAVGILDTVNFTANLTFRYATTGTYYIQINHRNSVETWSKSGGEYFNTGVNFNFDFTNSQLQAYGNNLTLKFGYWCIYSGDVNQSGYIDGSDLLMIHNDANNFITGYTVTDLNGDKIVDGSDLVIADNNAFNFVGVARP